MFQDNLNEYFYLLTDIRVPTEWVFRLAGTAEMKKLRAVCIIVAAMKDFGFLEEEEEISHFDRYFLESKGIETELISNGVGYWFKKTPYATSHGENENQDVEKKEDEDENKEDKSDRRSLKEDEDENKEDKSDRKSVKEDEDENKEDKSDRKSVKENSVDEKEGKNEVTEAGQKEENEAGQKEEVEEEQKEEIEADQKEDVKEGRDVVG